MMPPPGSIHIARRQALKGGAGIGRILGFLFAAATMGFAAAGTPIDLKCEPFRYFEDFESGTNPVRFWTSYNHKYAVNFEGVTQEKAHSGKRSFKLDVTLDETSRFLWSIPLARKVPAEGELTFSGYLFVADGSTAEATLGVSFALPPTKHSGCTAWGPLCTTTKGEWTEMRDELIHRGREKAQDIVTNANWGVNGSHVGALVERIIIDVRAKAGQRVVLYVDDLEIKGCVPSDTTYGELVQQRWAPAEASICRKMKAWEAELIEHEKALPALTALSPRATGMRDEVMVKLRDIQTKILAVKQAGEIRKKEQTEIDPLMELMKSVSANIQAVSDAEKDGRRALVYVVPPISPVMILPEDRYVPGKPGRSLSILAARGEYEPASFVVSAMSGIGSLSVSASDLRGERGTIPAACVDVKAVKCWYQAESAWEDNRRYPGEDKSKRKLIPELLLNDDALVRVDEKEKEDYLKLQFPGGAKYEWISDPTEIAPSRSFPVDEFPVKDSPVLLPVEIPAGRNKQFWLTVHVPGDAKPGIYTGTVLLKTPDETVSELTLNVEVLPFDLLPPYYTSSMDYHGRLDPSGRGTISSWVKSREQFRNELTNMVAHGLRNCQHYSIRKEILGEVLRIRAEVGMDNRTLYLKDTIPVGNPVEPAALEAIKRHVRDIIQFTKTYGTETVYFYGLDERQGEELRSQRAAWEAVREAGGKIFVAGWGDNIDMMGDIQDLHIRAGWPDREEVAKWHARGHKIFCYANPQTGVENPVVYRRNFGLLLWKYEYDGAATNAYQQTFGATWNDFDHPDFRAHTIAYPTVNGVIDTIAWEGYREGVDDVRYITTLEKAIENAKKSQLPERAASIAAAERFLLQLKTGDTIENGELDSVRREIVARILEVTKRWEPPAP
jgi:hypothetical protein